MRRLLICFVLLLSIGCAARQPKIVSSRGTGPGGIGGVLIEDSTMAMTAEFANLGDILKSDLPAETKEKLIESLMKARIEILKEIYLRKGDQAKNALQVLKDIGLFISALIAIRVGI